MQTSGHSTAIEKALSVLNAFDGPHLSLGIAELQTELGLPRSTLHRILKQLERQGFVRQLPSKRYQIGLRLFELGSLVSDQLKLRIPSIPHMHTLYEQTGCSVYLSVWTGDEILHLDCLPSKFEPPLSARAGGRWAAHCASLGKVLLAHAPVGDLERYLSKPLQPNTQFTISDPDALLAHLQEVRQQGFARTVEESILGVYGVAAPIWYEDEKVVAAICIAGRDRNLISRHQQVVAAAKAIGRDISRGGIARALR